MYKIFAVLHLKIRLFALLTAWKGNGTGVYAEISFHEFYTFFLFNLLNIEITMKDEFTPYPRQEIIQDYF